MHSILNILLAVADLVTPAVNFAHEEAKLFGRCTYTTSVRNISQVRNYNAVSRLQGTSVLAVVRSVELQLGLNLRHLCAKFLDHLNQVDVVDHDVEVVFFVNLTLFLKSFLESAHTVGQELLLVLILLLDVRVNCDCLHRLVLHILEQTVGDSTFKLVKIINILHHPVYSGLKALYLTFILADEHAVTLVKLVHLLLPVLQLINDQTQVSVDSVVTL